MMGIMLPTPIRRGVGRFDGAIRTNAERVITGIVYALSLGIINTQIKDIRQSWQSLSRHVF